MKKTMIAAMMVTMMATGAAFAADSVKSHCNIKVVSYIFTGAPGSSFSYNGKQHAIPVTGQIELIADQKTTSYAVAGGPVVINPEAARDSFGSVTIPLGTAGGGSASTSITTTPATR